MNCLKWEKWESYPCPWLHLSKDQLCCATSLLILLNGYAPDDKTESSLSFFLIMFDYFLRRWGIYIYSGGQVRAEIVWNLASERRGHSLCFNYWFQHLMGLLSCDKDAEGRTNLILSKNCCSKLYKGRGKWNKLIAKEYSPLSIVSCRE